MPDHLDGRLAEGRERLLDRIEKPEFAEVSRLASGIRRRRAAGSAAVVVAVLFAGTLAVRSMGTPDASPAPGASPSTVVPTPMVYSDAGVTISGVSGTPVNLPGQVFDVEYVDADRGYLLTGDCGPANDPCALTFAATGDGGRTWTVRAYPEAGRAVSRRSPPDLFALGQRLVITDRPVEPVQGDRLRRFVSDDGGQSWRTDDTPVSASRPWRSDGRPLLLDGAQTTRVVYGWQPSADGASIAMAPTQPPLTVKWLAAVPDAAGGWWVGGDHQGLPAISVTRDGGATWSAPRTFAADGGSQVRLATLGAHIYAVTYGTAVTVYHSGDLGRSFNAGTRSSRPSTLRGDPVALLDGRLLVVGDDGRWFVASDPGGSLKWQEAPSLHETGRLERTAYGYVAHDLTGDFTAFSVDGATWDKLTVI